MFKKFTSSLLKSGIAVVIAAYVFVLIIFFPGSMAHILAQKDTRLSVAPNPANPGATIMVNGFNYPATQKVEVYFQNKANGVVSATTNAGGFFNVPLTLPEKYIEGTAFVYATSDGFTTKALIKFAKPAVSYTAAAKSARTSFIGTGFLPNESVHFVLSAGNKTLKTGVERTDSKGLFALALASLDMPFGSAARFTVNDATRQALASISVHYYPRIHLSSFTGSIHNRLGVEGTGFKSGERVFIRFQGRVVDVVRADNNGRFSTQFGVPSWAGRSPYYNDVIATGIGSRASAVGSFQVLPSVTFDTNTGLPGQHITATGSQFTPGSPVQILLFSPSQGDSSVGTPLALHEASNGGTFKVHFTIPDNIQRRTVYSIVYIDVASGLNVTTYFKVR